MSIKTLKIDHILAFQHLSLSFHDGINVLIGENGTGKTSILKMIYTATQASNEEQMQEKRSLRSYFLNQGKDADKEFINHTDGAQEGKFEVSDGSHIYSECYPSAEALPITYEEKTQPLDLPNSEFGTRVSTDMDWKKLNISSVYIPTTEMLSHADGFLALNRKYRMPFDGTQIDIVTNASLPEARENPQAMTDILTRISEAIEGTVIQEKDTFYVVKEDGRKVEFSLEAEGLRKLGLLWKLIRNGLLEPGAVLIWDEPEANLNPELYELVAELLLSLAENKVQIFVATHSYNFAKYLEIRRKQVAKVGFINLFKNNFGQISSQSASFLKDLDQNHMMEADEKLLDEVYKDL